MDMDKIKLGMACKAARQSRLGNVQFRRSNVQDWEEESQYDCVYCRFLLTHLADPLRLLRQMLRAVRPGGVVVRGCAMLLPAAVLWSYIHMEQSIAEGRHA